MQNVGAYGQEVSGTIDPVRAFDTEANRIVLLPRSGLRISLSLQHLQHHRTPGRYIILRVNYRLKRGGTPTLKYTDLQKHFAERLAEKQMPTLAETRDAVRAIRRSKGMLIVPGDDDCRSAGSFFKNPVLTEEDFKELAERASAQGLEIPSYPVVHSEHLDSQHKVSAAWLVEHSGFAKGYVAGAAVISNKHALALINRGAAHASDIVALKDEIQQAVQRAWGILLEPEPVFVGF